MQSAKRAATHAANRERVTATARAQLARRGAAGLSLREVAREMGQTSSALYRYFATRDELLTALILDAYNDLGAAVERAEARVAREDLRGRWRSACRAIRRWARGHPHEYALIFGSPVPGYEAPELTVAAATRVSAVLAGIVVDRYRAAPRASAPAEVVAALEWPAVAAFMPGVPARAAVRALMAWTQVFGCVSFELFGHYVGSVRRPGAYFDLVVDELADLADLPALL
jgi:AcrR family transcriptional regulator